MSYFNRRDRKNRPNIKSNPTKEFKTTGQVIYNGVNEQRDFSSVTPFGLMDTFQGNFNCLPSHSLMLQCFINVTNGNVEFEDLPYIFNSSSTSGLHDSNKPEQYVRSFDNYDSYNKMIKTFKKFKIYSPYFDFYPTSETPNVNFSRFAADQVAKVYYDRLNSNKPIHFVSKPIPVLNNEFYNTKVEYGTIDKSGNKQAEFLYYNRIDLATQLQEVKKLDPYVYFLNMTKNLDNHNARWMNWDNTELEYLSYKTGVNLGLRDQPGMTSMLFTSDLPVPTYPAGSNTQISYRLHIPIFYLFRINEDTIRLIANNDYNYFYTGSFELPVINVDPAWLGLPSVSRDNATPVSDFTKYKNNTFINFLGRPNDGGGKSGLYHKLFFH